MQIKGFYFEGYFPLGPNTIIAICNIHDLITAIWSHTKYQLLLFKTIYLWQEEFLSYILLSVINLVNSTSCWRKEHTKIRGPISNNIEKWGNLRRVTIIWPSDHESHYHHHTFPSLTASCCMSRHHSIKYSQYNFGMKYHCSFRVPL